MRKPAINLMAVLLSALTAFSRINAQEQETGWSISTSLQMSGGKFGYDTNENLFFLYGGAGYQTDGWSINATIPIVKQSDNLIGQTGNGMFLPQGNGNNSNSGNSSMMGGNSGSGGMMNGSSGSGGGMMNSNFGLGDINTYGSLRLVKERTRRPEISANAFVKIPTAMGDTRIGTGKFDLGLSVSFKKTFNSLMSFAEFGYLNIGDPAGIEYKNPFTYSIGLGNSFGDGRYSLMVYYNGYSEVLENYSAPRQLSVGFGLWITDSISLLTVGSAGFGQLSPAYSFSTGVKFNFPD